MTNIATMLADNVAAVVVELLERPNLNGLFHWAGSEVISRFELGRRILERFSFSENLVKRGSSKNLSSGLDGVQKTYFLSSHLCLVRLKQSLRQSIDNSKD